MNGPVEESGRARPRKGLSFAQEFATPTAVVAVWVGLLGILLAAVSYVLPIPGWIRVLNVALCLSGTLMMGVSSWRASRRLGVSPGRVAWNSFLSAFNFFMLFP